jgi:ketosteroid isomerase-like protein
MNRDQLQAAQWECEQTLRRFYLALDSGDFQALAQCMTEDGVWHRQGKHLAGRAAIVKELSARGANIVSAHLINNVVADAAADGSIQLGSYIMVLRHQGDGSGAPIAMPAPRTLQRCSDRLVATADGWRIADKNGTVVFGGGH